MELGIGSMIGIIWTGIIFRFFIVGSLRIDRSDPSDGPYMFLELNKPVQSVTSKAYVILKVKEQDYISPK